MEVWEPFSKFLKVENLTFSDRRSYIKGDKTLTRSEHQIFPQSLIAGPSVPETQDHITASSNGIIS